MPSLGASDNSSLALESAVRHAFLLGSVKHYRNTISLGIGVHYSVDENPTSLSLALLQDTACTLTRTVRSLCHYITIRP